jgi:hypothetical protein
MDGGADLMGNRRFPIGNRGGLMGNQLGLMGDWDFRLECCVFPWGDWDFLMRNRKFVMRNRVGPMDWA